MDTETTPEPAPWQCVRCGHNLSALRPNGGVRCLVCTATYHLELDPQPAAVAELDRQEQEQLRRLEAEYPAAGGSLLSRPLLRPIPPEPADSASLARLVFEVDSLVDTGSRLGAQLDAGLGSAEATGKALAQLYRDLGRVAGMAEAVYGAGELGGWVLGALADPEGQE